MKVHIDYRARRMKPTITVSETAPTIPSVVVIPPVGGIVGAATAVGLAGGVVGTVVAIGADVGASVADGVAVALPPVTVTA